MQTIEDFISELELAETERYESKLARLKEEHERISASIQKRRRLLEAELEKAGPYLPTVPDPQAYRDLEYGLKFEGRAQYPKNTIGISRLFIRRMGDKYYFVEVAQKQDQYTVYVMVCEFINGKPSSVSRRQLDTFPAAPIVQLRANNSHRFCVSVNGVFWDISMLSLIANKVPNEREFVYALFTKGELMLFKLTRTDEGSLIEYSDGSAHRIKHRPLDLITFQNMAFRETDGRLAIFMHEPTPCFHRVRLSLFISLENIRFVRLDDRELLFYDDGYQDTCYSF